MSWKNNLQVRDLDPGQRLEMTCKRCGHVHYLVAAEVMKSPERAFLYLDQVEAETLCRARGCRGSTRMALIRRNDTSAFIGGLA